MNEYQAALTYWDEVFKTHDVEKLEGAFLGCEVLENKLKELALLHKILDFGCGTGWASLFLAQVGCASVVGVDQSNNAINIASDNAKLNNLSSQLQFICADEHYFDSVYDNTFKGFFSSNTLDVIPFDFAEKILLQVKRVCSSTAKIFIMINPYLTEEIKERNELQQISSDSYARDGVLRCVNKTNDEWINILEKYFTLVSYDEFKFDEEPLGYKRRLFILKNDQK